MTGVVLPGILFSFLFVLILLVQTAVAEQKYRVQRGDTLSLIAQKTKVTINDLKQANDLTGHILQIDQTLIIPDPNQKQKEEKTDSKSLVYEVKKGDCLFLIAKKTGVRIDEIRRINRLPSNRLKIGQRLLLKEANTVEADAVFEKEEPAAVSNEEPNIRSEKEANDLAMSSGDFPQNKGFSSDQEKLLGKWRYPEEKHLLVKVAMAFLGAPYRLGGFSVRGMDCSGFVKKIYGLFDIELPRTAAEQSGVGIQVAKSDLSEGDLIFFKKKNRISHVGIYIGNNQFIHSASNNKGVRVDSLDSPYYKRHYKSAVRLKSGDEVSVLESTSTNKEPAESLFAQTSLAEAHR